MIVMRRAEACTMAKKGGVCVMVGVLQPYLRASRREVGGWVGWLEYGCMVVR